MSRAVPPTTDLDRDTARAFFWISPTDERGIPVDKEFAEAAYRKANHLRRYRSRELRDEAIRANLVETAVYKCSRAQREEPLGDIAGYLFLTFKRLVDEWIARDQRIQHHPDVQLDRYNSPKPSFGDLDAAVARREALDAMDAESRWAWERRLVGFQVQEIARELNITPDCLSTRLRRGMEQAAGRLFGKARIERK
jgi:DNA-directed RNA polymerase specialized sigma24 family protein